MQKHPWIQDRLEESGNYSHQGWGEFTFNQHKVPINRVLRVDSLKTHFFQSRISFVDNLTFLVNWPQTPTYMQANTNAHAHTRRHTYTHTLPDLAYKKMCVCEQRIFFVGGADTHTPSRSSAGSKLWRAQPKKKQQRDTYSITMSDSYSTTWIHCIVFRQRNIIPL